MTRWEKGEEGCFGVCGDVDGLRTGRRGDVRLEVGWMNALGKLFQACEGGEKTRQGGATGEMKRKAKRC